MLSWQVLLGTGKGVWAGLVREYLPLEMEFSYSYGMGMIEMENEREKGIPCRKN